MKVLAIFLVGSVLCAAWLIVKSQEQYDTDQDDDPYDGDWGV